MSVVTLFPTRVYSAALLARGASAFNAKLLAECQQLRLDDRAGRHWSKNNYPGGYTSYGSANRMHAVSPTFAQLARHLAGHVRTFCSILELDLSVRKLHMTDCWVNIMPYRTAHNVHLHPLSTLSGTYYVKVPRGSSGLKFEDPRLDRMMAAPPRLPDAACENRPWVTLPATAGEILLFESWLRHEVPANTTKSERISISFNFSWF